MVIIVLIIKKQKKIGTIDMELFADYIIFTNNNATLILYQLYRQLIRSPTETVFQLNCKLVEYTYTIHSLKLYKII